MNSQEIISVVSLVIAMLAMIWGVFQTFVAHNLNQELNRLNVQLGERVKRLHRARELVNQEQVSHLFLRSYREALGDERVNAEVWATEYGKMMAAKAELRGLAFAIGDKDLLDLINKGMNYKGDLTWDEMTIRGQAQKLHTRIAELLEVETSNHE